MSELIINGQLQSKTGAECTMLAGVCCLSGAQLHRECLTPHIARINRIKKGEYSFTRSDGQDGGMIEATDRRQAMLQWYVAAVSDLENSLECANARINASIEDAAIEIFKAAINNSGTVKIGGWAGVGRRAIEAGDGGYGCERSVSTNDIFKFATMMGMQCHLRNNYIFIGINESAIGKKMYEMWGDSPEE